MTKTKQTKVSEPTGMTKKQLRKHTVIVVVKTILIVAFVSGLVVYHLLAVKNAELKGFAQGAATVKAILTDAPVQVK